jgi:hypothetical protein
MSNLLSGKLEVINIGLASFAEAIAAEGGGATQVEWTPPASGDRAVGEALAKLVGNPTVEAANRQAFERYLAAQPRLVGVGVARDMVPGITERTILHAGAPIEYGRMCGPMLGGIAGALVYEGWASDLEAAAELAASGAIAFDSCHHHAAVGPMAGVLSPSMPVWIVENPVHGNRSFSTLNEGLGKVLRYGANSAEVLQRLKWFEDVLAPSLQAALEVTGPIELKPLMAQALHMGDEMHNRNVAATTLLFRKLATAMAGSAAKPEHAAASLEFLAANDFSFLNVSMAACKAMLDAAHGVEGSSMVTAMARNGVEFGIRLSGTGRSWFTAPAPRVNGLYFPGYSIADAAPDLGDSAITETAGIGGFAMASALAIVKFVGGTPEEALAYTRDMAHITLGRNPAFTLPALNFAGTPAGIDARKVVDTGLEPIVNTGIAHKSPGVGQIGAGITRAPLPCFVKGIAELASRMGA